MKKDLLAMLPELFLLGGAVLTLLVGSFSPRERQWRARLVAFLAAGGALVTAALAFATQSTHDLRLRVRR